MKNFKITGYKMTKNPDTFEMERTGNLMTCKVISMTDNVESIECQIARENDCDWFEAVTIQPIYMDNSNKQQWTTTECSNGGLIVCLGDETNWKVQRIQIADVKQATLIAAAPELLDVLLQAQQNLEQGLILPSTERRINEVIKKATE